MDKYNWDLTKIIKDDKEYNNILIEIDNLTGKVTEYKNKILHSSENLYNVLSSEEKVNYLCEKIYIYSYLKYYSNTKDTLSISYKEKADNIYEKVNVSLSFITPELLKKNYNYVKKFINENDNLKKYDLLLEKIYRYSKHVLSSKEEKILSNMSLILDSSRSIYTSLNDADIFLGNIKDDNNEDVILTHHNYTKYLESKNENTRKDAFNKMYAYYKNHINTFSSIYLSNIKSDVVLSNIRKYKSTLASELFDDNINEKLFKNLIKVTSNNSKLLQKYYSIKSKVLNKKLHMYDLYLNINTINNKEISFDEAIRTANKALSVLGNDYLKEFNNIINSNQISVYPSEGKKSGAFEWAVYGIMPYVMLNYQNNIDSLSTLVHEMGHAMHSHYSSKKNDFIYASYPIFIAEVASTVNEILLSEYLYNKSTSLEDKIYYLVEFLDKFKATVFRQVMFSEFEYNIHKMYQNADVITKDVLCNEYLKLNKKQFGKSVIIDDDIKYEWARIPHFYTSYYVYKYATGFISALIIADKLLKSEEGFKDKYINFLSSGSTKFPLDLLKELGIDLENMDVLNYAFNIFNEKIKLLEKYIEEKGY